MFDTAGTADTTSMADAAGITDTADEADDVRCG
jgi:hypothetical protein